MNPDTGAIAQFENEEDAKRAGHTVQLTTDEARKLYQVGREERTAALDLLRGVTTPPGYINRQARRAAEAKGR